MLLQICYISFHLFTGHLLRMVPLFTNMIMMFFLTRLVSCVGNINTCTIWAAIIIRPLTTINYPDSLLKYSALFKENLSQPQLLYPIVIDHYYFDTFRK